AGARPYALPGQLHRVFHRPVLRRGTADAAPVCETQPDAGHCDTREMMCVQEAAQHGAAAAEGHAEKFNAGETIIHHVANSPIDEPLIHLPTIAGIDFSVNKTVLMLWL